VIVCKMQVPDAVIDAVVQRMRSGQFECATLISVARSMWPDVPAWCHDRLADRLIQRESKSGRISRVGGRVWEPG